MSTSTSNLDGDELRFVAARLASATSPVDVFGQMTGSPPDQMVELRRRYHQLALSVHPDRHGQQDVAHQAFKALHRFFEQAEAKLRAGDYGQPPAAAVTIETRRRTYVVREPLAAGDLANLYTALATGTNGTRGAILKVTRDGQDDDLLANEASALRRLAMPFDNQRTPAYIPTLLESFVYQDEAGDSRRANAFPLASTEDGPLPARQFYTLQEVHEAYPDGVDPRQMAWIWRRLLIALGAAHDREVVHGAVLPTHILIHPEAHGLLLVDWCASVQQPDLSGEHIPFVSAGYEAWYPPLVLTKSVPTPAVDLEMGVRCMVHLLGGDPLTGVLPPMVPGPIRAYLSAALRVGATRTDAWRLYRDFADLLRSLWGERKFVPFTMPARA